MGRPIWIGQDHGEHDQHPSARCTARMTAADLGLLSGIIAAFGLTFSLEPDWLKSIGRWPPSGAPTRRARPCAK